MLKYKYISQIKYAEKVLSNSTQKLLWFEITRMLIAVFRKINLLCHLLKFSAHFRFLCAMKYVLDYGRWAVEVCVFRRSSRQLLGVAGGRPV